MAVTAFASGTLSPATVGSEDFLSSPDEAGTYQLVVDTTNMAAGDVVELRGYQKVLTGGTAKVVYCATYTGVQLTDDQIKVSLPIVNDLAESNAVRFSLTQKYGTGRNFDYKVLKVA